MADEVVCAKVIYCLCREGCLDEALELCKEMELKGTMPNEVTYNSIIDVLCIEGRLVESFRLFDAMERAVHRIWNLSSGFVRKVECKMH